MTTPHNYPLQERKSIQHGQRLNSVLKYFYTTFMRTLTYVATGNVKATYYGLQLIKYLARKIGNLVPDRIKTCLSLTKLKKLIKS